MLSLKSLSMLKKAIEATGLKVLRGLETGQPVEFKAIDGELVVAALAFMCQRIESDMTAANRVGSMVKST